MMATEFKHNPVSSFARAASFYFSVPTAAGCQVLRWQEVLLTWQQQNKAPVAPDGIHGEMFHSRHTLILREASLG
ncbi:hypothetical protein EYF80_036875 [Liparis tanakae]|uniref:Uncharacterized protein n=1 Tax=Liparis tanakae TaxID=230148 RepID=A0A4Z2GHA1_9TELE|nr:hypothetical protein EYF80_036875 [Liparis tanakae]